MSKKRRPTQQRKERGGAYKSANSIRPVRRDSRIIRATRFFLDHGISFTIKQQNMIIAQLSKSETLIYHPIHGKWYISQNEKICGKGYQSLLTFLIERTW